MAIHWREDLKRRWPVIVYADPYTVAEWERTMTEILAHPISTTPLRLLVDRRYCQAPAGDFVRQIAAFVRRYEDRFHGASVAIVASDLAGYGVARMTELLVAEQVKCAIRAFRDWNEADRWLDATVTPTPTA
jgi:hypothetical protein